MTIRELYSLMVLKFNISPGYFLDEMSWQEVNCLLENQQYSVQESWEQTRFISYLIAQTNSKKKLKLEDIIKFYWEKESQNIDSQQVTKEDNERLKQKAEYIQKLLAKQQDGKFN